MHKKFSLIVIPHHKGRVFETKVSLPLLYALLLFLVILLSVNFYLTFSSIHKIYQGNKIVELQKENTYLEQKITSFNSLVNQLKREMNNLVQREKNVRLVFGLPEIDDDIREVGIGGPTYPGQNQTGPATMKANLTQDELDKLLRQSKFEGENLEQMYLQLLDKRAILDHTPSIKPVNGYFSRGFGMKNDPFTGLMQFHQGMDLAADRGTPIYAPADGKVIGVSRESGMGKKITIDHGYGYKTVYGHLYSIKVVRGQMVKRGDVIGAVGSTGYSTGPHLHYEVHYNGKPVDPTNYVLSGMELLD